MNVLKVVFFLKKFKFFGKEAKTDANTSKTCFFGVFLIFFICWFFFKKKRVKNWVATEERM